MNKIQGFTLIEMMVVLSIISILAAVALPNYQLYIEKSQLADALSMASTLKKKVNAYYEQQLAFPKDNEQAGLPAPKFLIGNRISGVVLEDGALHISLGNKVSKYLQGKILTFRPAVVTGSPTSPIAWLCGFDEPVPGMEARGQNKTDLEAQFLPVGCRARHR